MLALGAHSRTKGKVAKSRKGEPGVVDADNRIVFAVLAVGMLVGALLTTPAKPSKHADLTTKAQTNHAGAGH